MFHTCSGPGSWGRAPGILGRETPASQEEPGKQTESVVAGEAGGGALRQTPLCFPYRTEAAPLGLPSYVCPTHAVCITHIHLLVQPNPLTVPKTCQPWLTAAPPTPPTDTHFPELSTHVASWLCGGKRAVAPWLLVTEICDSLHFPAQRALPVGVLLVPLMNVSLRPSRRT